MAKKKRAPSKSISMLDNLTHVFILYLTDQIFFNHLHSTNKILKKITTRYVSNYEKSKQKLCCRSKTRSEQVTKIDTDSGQLKLYINKFTKHICR